MEVSNFVPAILILLAVGMQLVIQQAIIPAKFGVRFVSKSERPKFFRFVVRFWLTAALLYSLGIVSIHYFTTG